ncbi:MAG: ABC transporter substrate-binding protein [Rhizobiales bacterium]|nr:ABC transporter substrate-binding protein [Hyphomicrobiales bacterium]
MASFRVDRRQFAAGAGSAALLLLPGAALPAPSPAYKARLSKSLAGTAGTLQDGMIAKFPEVSQGLEIDWVDGDPGQLQVFILSGAIDSGPFGALGLAEAAQKGADLLMFGPRLNNHGSWIVRGDSPFKHPSDLKGRKIATQLPTSDTYRHARMAAALHKLDLQKDFQVIFGSSIANIALFNRGDVDAVIAIEPTSTRLIAQGHREIARVADQWQEATGDSAPLSLVTCAGTRQWVEKNPETARRVGAQALAINRKFVADPTVVRDPDIYRPMGFKDTDKAAIDLLVERLPRVYATEWNKAVFDGFDRQLEVALSLGIIEKKPAKRYYQEL